MEISLDKKNLLWILEDDRNCQFVYESILGLRYELQFFNTLKEFTEALEGPNYKRPQLLIAEILLSDGHFIQFIGESKAKLEGLPFFIISSVDDLDALRYCFKEGAVEYLTKPFRKNELLVKVENYLSGDYKQPVLNIGTKDFAIDGKRINNLTVKQFHLLSLFAAAKDRKINRQIILEAVWGGAAIHPKAVDVHLYNLRKKLLPFGLAIRSEGRGQWTLISEMPQQKTRLEAQL